MKHNKKKHNQNIKILITAAFFFLFYLPLFSQDYKIEIFIDKLPDNKIITGSVRGDKFTPADTVVAEEGTVKFTIPENEHTGVYRVILGQTVYAQVMHEPPQKIDFIFNKEDVILRTDFEHPFDSLTVVSSNENNVWHKFLAQENIYSKELNDLVRQINYFQHSNDEFYTEKKKQEIIRRYNDIQHKRDELITAITTKYPDLYAAKLIKMYRSPFLDGNLPKEKRDSVYSKEFFKLLNFSNPSLMNSEIITDRIFEYIMNNVPADQPRERQIVELKNTVDRIIDNTSANEEVNDFVVDYLLRGFERLGFTEVLNHIADLYTPKVPCTSDSKSTFRRRLDFLKMKKGMTVPDFKLLSITGDSVSLADVQSEYKLILFWASWCPHCEQLLPDIYQWYLNRSLDVEVVAISVDTNPDAWKEFLQNRGYNWINCVESDGWDGKVAVKYNVYATPTMFLIDNENKIIAKPLSFSDFLNSINGLE
ncbi:MAG: AhpC/TSA family protein [Chlorobi bacterium]|nr:AhpC/TSA family protein [Chlorobiota bacterium]